jgi:predicted house-cleaning NTP pyrophosphatase (Maf/HAM1 superfamily)
LVLAVQSNIIRDLEEQKSEDSSESQKCKSQHSIQTGGSFFNEFSLDYINILGVPVEPLIAIEKSF